MEQSEVKILAPGEALKPAALSDSDLQKFGKNLKEVEELLALEEQYQKAAEDLSHTKTKLSEIEVELQKDREKEREREQKLADLWREVLQKEEAGLWEQALDLHLEIVEWNPRHARSITHIQDIKKRLRERENERVAKEQESLRKQEAFEKYFLSAERWFSQNEFPKALQDFREAGFADPNHAGVRAYQEQCEQKIREAAEKDARELAEKQENQRQVDDCVLEAGEKIRREDFEAALILFEKALRLQPEDASLQKKLNEAEKAVREQKAEALKNKETAEASKRKIASLEVEAWNAWGSGDFSKALSLWGEIVGLDFSRADVLEQIRKEQESRLRREEENKKMHAETNQRVQELYSEGMIALARLDWEGALEKFSSVLLLRPGHAEAEAKLPELARKKEKRAEEQKKLREQELQQSESDKQEDQRRTLERHSFQAEACMASGDFERALSFWEKAFEVDSRDRHIKEGIRKAQLAFRQREGALRSQELAEAFMENRRKKMREQEKEFQEASRLFRDGCWDQARKCFESIVEMIREGEGHGGLGR